MFVSSKSLSLPPPHPLSLARSLSISFCWIVVEDPVQWKFAIRRANIILQRYSSIFSWSNDCRIISSILHLNIKEVCVRLCCVQVLINYENNFMLFFKSSKIIIFLLFSFVCNKIKITSRNSTAAQSEVVECVVELYVVWLWDKSAKKCGERVFVCGFICTFRVAHILSFSISRLALKWCNNFAQRSTHLAISYTFWWSINCTVAYDLFSIAKNRWWTFGYFTAFFRCFHSFVCLRLFDKYFSLERNST